MPDLKLALLALLPLLAIYALSTYRKKFAHIPHAYPNSLFLGHIPHFGRGFKRRGDYRMHPDYIMEDLFTSASRPDILFLDIRPTMHAMVVISSHSIAEQVTKSTKQFPYSVTKSPTLQSGLGELIGPYSLLSSEGEAWKSMRRRFNPGFAPSHLLTLLPQILEKTALFVAKLEELAEKGEAVKMDPLCTNLTFDIIGKVVTGLDFAAQDEENQHDIVRYFTRLSKTFDAKGRTPWIPRWIDSFTKSGLERRKWAYLADKACKQCVADKFEEMKAAREAGEKESKDRSVLALALADTEVLTERVLQVTADQVRTFLFAGHDTTSILLQRLFYAFAIHPKCLEKIREEHDQVFGDRDPSEVFLEHPDATVKALSYTSACIKEGLRLWPPAGSARMAKPGTGFKIRLSDGQEVCVDGTVLYVSHYLIQRDPKVYGETANDFIPERWLGDTDTSAEKKDEAGEELGGSKIPISAWRPFERGPRNCIGQELANLEARVILACVLRRYDLIKVGAGEVELDEQGKPIMDEKGVYKTKSFLFNSQQVTSRPYDGCVMRIQRRG
ncbi:cytochrome P450 [Sporormia fimetaria CBS 119925]|uniref:Cytochrome P450 n=1 Tax=Sporormia fimetaria CBS 119925 TaxID=1340428 RepID=A0A6A6VHY6_9PLEO|nr:cytochrome P450 [Sporormia fimetaria CBS 119925]